MAGLRPGDVILELNRKVVKGAEDAVQLTEEAKDKRTLVRVWSRGGKRYIVVDETKPLPMAPGQTLAYEQIAGRAFGELDPALPGNAGIQDIRLGLEADGKLRYVASFVITRPVDAAQASGLMWHDVPNRGTPIAINVRERNFGDIGLASAWQGDNAGGTAIVRLRLEAPAGEVQSEKTQHPVHAVSSRETTPCGAAMFHPAARCCASWRRL